jgi:NAD(P)H-dependent FMN reductase
MSDCPLGVVLVIASTRAEQFADVLVPWLVPLLRKRAWLDLTIADLAKTDLTFEVVPGGTASDVSEVLAAADAFVVLTPEYNHAYPGQLKHFIDPHYADWDRKPVTFVSYGAGSGGIRAVEQLRGVFSDLRATTVRNIVTLNSLWTWIQSDRGFVPPPGTDDAVDATLTELRWWGDTLRAGRQKDLVR